MSRKFDPDDPVELERWTRAYYKISDDESTDVYLIRTGILADTPRALATRLYTAVAWIEPWLTEQTRPIIEQVRAVLADFERKQTIVGSDGSQIRHALAPQQPMTNAFTPAQAIAMPQPGTQPVTLKYPPPLTEADKLQLEKAQVLFEQAKALYRLQPSVEAQQRFKKAQSERASKPRAPLLDELTRKRIAKRYWDSKQNGTAYGLVKELARQYEVTTTTIQAIVKKHKPDSIDN